MGLDRRRAPTGPAAPLEGERELAKQSTRGPEVGLAATLLFLPLFAQEPVVEVRAGAPLALEVAPADPELEGKGPSRAVRYVAVAQGKAYVYALSTDFDAWMRIESRDGTVVAEDDSSGGGSTPFVALDVEPDLELRVVVASATRGRSGRVSLHVHEAPETEETSNASAWLHGQLEEARELALQQGNDATRPGLRAALKSLASVAGVASSAEAADALAALAHAAAEFGDTATAVEAWERALAQWERCFPLDHPGLIAERAAFGTYLEARGELRKAVEQLERVAASRARTLPEGHDDLFLVRESMVKLLRALGEHERARVVQLAIVQSALRTRPADDVRLAFARVNLASTLAQLGDLPGARALFEHGLEVLEAQLASEDPRLAELRARFARVLDSLGDLGGAAAELELVLDVEQRVLADDHPALLRTRGDLGRALREKGEFARARELLERVLAVRSRTLAEDDPEVVAAMTHLALAMGGLGEHARARELQEQALEALSLALSPGHPAVVAARVELATTLARLGEFAPARSELERALAALGASVPPERNRARVELLWTLAAMKEAAATRAIALELCTHLTARLRAAAGSPSPREAEAIARNAAPAISAVLSVAAGAGVLAPSAELDREAFALIEAARGGAGSWWSSAHAASLARVRQASPASKRSGAELFDARKLAAALAPDEAAVAFWCYAGSELDPARARQRASTERMLAFVLRPGAALARVELGAAAEIEAAVAAWRAALDQEAKSTEKGRALRALVLDPLRPALADARRIAIVPDGVLHLVAFEALPDGELGGELGGESGGAIVGDRLEIVRPSRWADLTRRSAPRAEGSLVLLGAIDPDGEPLAAREGSSAAVFTPAPALHSLGDPPFSTPFPETASELAAVAELYGNSFESGAPAVRLEGASATRATLTGHASAARFLHLATRGWFSHGDANGVSPLARCGLALTGLRRPPDALARLGGVISADELAALDLSSCELAVLSCLDPDRSARGAAEAVASLQLALHAAGAQSVLTSVSAVSDAARRELVLDVYRGVWVEKKSVALALAEARRRMREATDARGRARFSTRDWAAWVVSGATR